MCTRVELIVTSMKYIRQLPPTEFVAISILSQFISTLLQHTHFLLSETIETIDTMTTSTPATGPATALHTSSSTRTTQSTPLRLWVIPWGLYPRRVTIYLREKQLGPEIIEVIPVYFDLSTGKLAASPGRPEGTLPVLEVKRPSKEGGGDGEYVMQSTAILEYLEDLTAGGGFDADTETRGEGIEALSAALSKTKNMRGKTTFECSQVRQALQILDEATTMFGLYVNDASKLFVGLTVMEQSEEAAVRAWERTKRLLNLLEAIAEESKSNSGNQGS
jgi:glutathione S-transferase